MTIDIAQVNFEKSSGLIPVVIQDDDTLQVLMLGYMNKEALLATLETKKVTFYSRSKNRLWVKGETSSNYLILKDIHIDCDNDTLLIMVNPCGPTCHLGNVSCFGDQKLPGLAHIGYLDKIIRSRIMSPQVDSYTNKLLERGLNKVAQKVGEEAVEVVIAALAESDTEFLGEMTDLIYHYLVLLHAKDKNIADIAAVIANRHAER